MCTSDFTVSIAAPLTGRETLVFLDKLAKLERMGATEGPIKAAWEDSFLDTLHHLCSHPDPPDVRR